MSDSLTLVHFSDTHIVWPGVRLRDVDTIESLRRVIDVVNGLEPQPAFVIVGGDLVSPDSVPEVRAKARPLTVRDYETSYAIFHDLVGRLRVPVHYVMGNHDLRVPFRRVLLGDPQPTDQRYYYAFRSGEYRICILDSLQHREDGGYLGQGSRRRAMSAPCCAGTYIDPSRGNATGSPCSQLPRPVSNSLRHRTGLRSQAIRPCCAC
jgi:3',5'-cyclic AMP phosphodiesterase CpdA